jgi:hypothetical protein
MYLFLFFTRTKVMLGAVLVNKIYKFSHSRLGRFEAWDVF